MEHITIVSEEVNPCGWCNILLLNSSTKQPRLCEKTEPDNHSNLSVLLKSHKHNGPHRLVTQILKLWSNNLDSRFHRGFVMEIPGRNNLELGTQVIKIVLFPSQEYQEQGYQKVRLFPTLLTNLICLYPVPSMAENITVHTPFILFLVFALFFVPFGLLLGQIFLLLKCILISCCCDMFLMYKGFYLKLGLFYRIFKIFFTKEKCSKKLFKLHIRKYVVIISQDNLRENYLLE